MSPAGALPERYPATTPGPFAPGIPDFALSSNAYVGRNHFGIGWPDVPRQH